MLICKSFLMKLKQEFINILRGNEALRKIFTNIENNGFDVRIVGGFVRDAIMGIVGQNTEIDLSTTATPDKIIDIFAKSNSGILVKDCGGKKFGTLILIYKGISYEITTTREDIKTFGRSAEVSFCSSFEIDSQRRDFTINALYCDLYGNILDFHRGINDIFNRKLRFIGDARKRIQEDYLRIIRYFRFLSIFPDIEIDANVVNLCKEMSNSLSLLSGERIKSEIIKIMLKKNSYIAIEQMYFNDILQIIFSRNIRYNIDLLRRLDGYSSFIKLAALFFHPKNRYIKEIKTFMMKQSYTLWNFAIQYLALNVDFINIFLQSKEDVELSSNTLVLLERMHEADIINKITYHKKPSFEIPENIQGKSRGLYIYDLKYQYYRKFLD